MASRVFSSSTAKWSVLSCVALLAALGFWALRPGPSEYKAATAAQPSEQAVHYVSPRQLTATAAQATARVPALTATTDRNQVFTWPHPNDSRPLVLIFIKKGCPCSVDLEPFFQRLEHAYGEAACFAGVIDGDIHSAHRYAQANATPYPILADPHLQIIHRFRAENGAYVALLSLPATQTATTGANAQADAVIDTLWPGCSAELLTQMGQRIAAVTGVAQRPVDVSGLPSAPITGCPFAP